jgi:hypothetical protein
LDCGIAAMTDRKSSFTDSEDLKTAATSGSRTTVTVPFDSFDANLFGFDFA